MTALSTLVRAVTGAFRPATICPLCVGTRRATIAYPVDELGHHALQEHPIQDVWTWARENHPMPEAVDLVDSWFLVYQEFTTEISATDDGEHSWMCTLCNANEVGFPSVDAAMADRVATHRCPR